MRDTDPSFRLNPNRWVANHREYLLRYAQSKVRNFSIADDLVQEVFLAAWKSRRTFEGRATERTWLTRILINKISDYYRTAASKPLLLASQVDADACPEEILDLLSAADASSDRANDHGDPICVAERNEVFARLDQCLARIPKQAADAFRMRELQGLSTEVIAERLNVTPNHLWVLIYRAKRALRKQLGDVWAERAA